MSVAGVVELAARHVVKTVTAFSALGILGGIALGAGVVVAAERGVAGSAAYGALEPTSPVRLVVPSLEVDAKVIPISVDSDRVLDPPRDAKKVGWWRLSAKPGATAGQTVITGHTVHTGGGSMDRIKHLKAGRSVDVVTKAGTMRYRVTGVKDYSKAAVAKKAERLFGQDRGAGQLVLITCDDWNGRFYESNVVVTAEPLGSPA